MTLASVSALVLAASGITYAGAATALETAAPLTTSVSSPASTASDTRATEAGSPSLLAGERSHLFSSSSPWYSRLPDYAPLDPSSSEIVANINAQARNVFTFGNGRPGLAMNTTVFSPTLYVSRPTDAITPVRFRNCFGGTHVPQDLVEQMKGVRIPWGAKPSAGSDSEMGVYDPASDTVYEFWQITPGYDGWTACWGGAIPHASTAQGVFSAPYGAAACGLSFFGGVIRYDELVRGEIDHAIGIAMPETLPGVVSWPANRTDGRNPSGRRTVAQGQLLRLPADLDLSTLGLNRIEMAVAKSAQTYGMRVWDSAGALSLRAENPTAWGGSSRTYTDMFQAAKLPNMKHLDVFANFPLDKLQVVQRDFGKPS